MPRTEHDTTDLDYRVEVVVATPDADAAAALVLATRASGAGIGDDHATLGYLVTARDAVGALLTVFARLDPTHYRDVTTIHVAPDDEQEP